MYPIMMQHSSSQIVAAEDRIATAQLTPANLQIGPLVEAGFWVIAPDLRGAVGGESDAPMEVEAYDIQKVIVNDITGKALVACLHP